MAHELWYRLALVVGGKCVLRYDNEAGKGDHRHVGRFLGGRRGDAENENRDSFASADLLWKVLAAKRRELLKAMTGGRCDDAARSGAPRGPGTRTERSSFLSMQSTSISRRRKA
jgi:hypothetical protein